jgi:hypothetical protein
MEEIKRELVKEGEGRPELAVQGESIIKVMSNGGVGRKDGAGSFPGKTLPDWREYSRRCPRKRREWLASMEKSYRKNSGYTVMSVSKNGNDKEKEVKEGREGFSEKLEPIPVMKRPARYRRYCLAKFMGMTFEDSESNDQSSDDGGFDFPFIKRKREDKASEVEIRAESSRKNSTFERDGEDGRGCPDSKTSRKTKIQRFLGQYSLNKEAVPDYMPKPVPTDALEKGEESKQRPARRGKSQPYETKESDEGNGGANMLPPSKSLSRARRRLPSPWIENQQQGSLALYDYSKPVQNKPHCSSYKTTQTYITTHESQSLRNMHDDSSQALSKASSSKTPIVHNSLSLFHRESLQPLPSDGRKMSRQLVRDNKDVESYVSLEFPLIPTPSPSSSKQGDMVQELGGISDKGKEKHNELSELRTACKTRLDQVAHEAAEKARKEIRWEREIAENEEHRQERIAQFCLSEGAINQRSTQQ